MSVDLRLGDCRQRMAEMPDNSVDAVVCDPPYELGFMGKSWDASGIAYDVEVWRQAFRVLKPGGHLLAFSGSRTYHRMTCAIEDAGFEIRDQIMWVYGSGFPKSLDVSKAIDRAAGAEREVVGANPSSRPNSKKKSGRGFDSHLGEELAGVQAITAPATDAARQWSGWGTALKPAHEPICMARKPFIGTVAANVLAHGTGAINVDGCRVGLAEGENARDGNVQRSVSVGYGSATWQKSGTTPSLGRWPANFIHDGSEEATAGLGEAARFFYCAKASRSDREDGLNATTMLCSCEATRAQWDEEDRAASILAVTGTRQKKATTVSMQAGDSAWRTMSNGNSITDASQMGLTFTTSTETNRTTESKTLSSSPKSTTSDFILDATCVTESGGSRAEAVESESPLTEQTGISRQKTIPSMDDADHATSASSSRRSVRVCPRCGKLDRKHSAADAVNREEGSAGMDSPRAGAGRTAVGGVWCSHPTVKPTELMRYLCRMVTPPGGTVLDPFMGSGSTGRGAVLEGFNFIGIEMNEDYLAIAQARINATIPPLLRGAP